MKWNLKHEKNRIDFGVIRIRKFVSILFNIAQKNEPHVCSGINRYGKSRYYTEMHYGREYHYGKSQCGIDISIHGQH